MRNPNIAVSSAIFKNREFLSDISNAVYDFYTNHATHVISNDARELRVFEVPDAGLVYAFDQDKDSNVITVSQVQVYSFHKSLNETLEYNIKAITDNSKVYTDELIIKIPECFVNMDVQKADQAFAEVENSFIDDLKLTLKSTVDNVEKKMYEYLIANPWLEIATAFKFDTTSNVGSLFDLSKVLDTYQVFDMHKYDSDFYLNLNAANVNTLQDEAPTIGTRFMYMLDKCKEHSHTNKKSSYAYNDGDNYIWKHSNFLVFTGQNYGLLIDLKDALHFNVYHLHVEYGNGVTKEIKRIAADLKNNTVDKIHDLILSVNNNEVVYAASHLSSCVEMDARFGVNFMEMDGYGSASEIFDVDISSYSYLRDYYYTEYGYDEFQFLAQTFLTVGGGFDYNEKKGIFYDSGVSYLTNLTQDPNKREGVKTKFNYCYPKKDLDYTNLSAEWLDGLIYLVHVLKTDKPTPVAYAEKFDEAVSFFENVISEIKKQKRFDQAISVLGCY